MSFPAVLGMVFVIASNLGAQGLTKEMMTVIAGGAENSSRVGFAADFTNVGAFWEHLSAGVCIGGWV